MPSRSCLTVIFCVILSCVAAFALHSLYATGAFAIWHPLGQAPEMTISIHGLSFLGKNSVNVYLKSTSGRFYKRNTLSQEGWRLVSAPDLISGTSLACLELSPMTQSAAEYRYMDRLPGKAKDCAKINYSLEWSFDELLVVMLEDNSLWWYHRESSIGSFFIFVVVGLAVGVAAGLLIGRRSKFPNR